MPSTARQLRQPPTIEAIGRVPYFADVIYFYPKQCFIRGHFYATIDAYIIYMLY